MKLLHEVQLKTCDGNAWYPRYSMDFTVFKGKVYYCYKLSHSSIGLCVIDGDGKYIEKTYDFGRNVGLPRNPYFPWQYEEERDELLLFIDGAWLNISKEQISHKDNFKRNISPYVPPCNQVYVFDHKAISFPTERTVVCKNLHTKEVYWKHVLKAYPYTIVEEKYNVPQNLDTFFKKQVDC